MKNYRFENVRNEEMKSLVQKRHGDSFYNYFNRMRFENFSEFLSKGFFWRLTIEGYDFWKNISRKSVIFENFLKKLYEEL